METAKCMYQYRHNLSPEPLSEIFIDTIDVHSHSTRQSSQIRPPPAIKQTTMHNILFNGPKVWNFITLCTQNKPNIKGYVSALRYIVFQRYSDLVV